MPRRGTSDYDEESPTTLDPFSLHPSELVVIPRAGTDGVREELRADPDVQDALRWLDPPSNAGVPGQGPVVDPTSAPYAQVYTPVPHPGAGPYPTPVPNFVPNTGGYYLVTPIPGAQPAPMPPPARSPIVWILLTALVTGGGIALGWWMVAGPGSEWRRAAPAKPAAPEPAAPQPGVAPPTAPAQPEPPEKQPEPPPEKQPEPAPAAAPVSAEVVSLTPAGSVPVNAPLSGQVSRLFLTEAAKVAKGAKLIEIRTEAGGGARAKKLAERVAELEELAKSDPVYEEFLADARKAQRAARGTSKVTVVKAPSAGHARLEVAQGDQVAGGKPIGRISTGGDWTVTAAAKGEVLRSWTCHLELPDGKRAPCAIDKVVASAAGTDITATVKAADAPWLEDVSQKPTLALEPP